MMLWGGLVLLAGSFIFVEGWVDTLSLPAWKTRNLYRGLWIGSSVIAYFATLKAFAYHAELVTLIQVCR